MADVSFVLNYPVPELKKVPLEELFEWHELAKERSKFR